MERMTKWLDSLFQQALTGVYIVYQPIVQWSGRRIIGYEALVRSREPALRHPGDLLDAAEQLGRLQELGTLVRTQCTRPLHYAPNDALLFVNLHPTELLDEALYAPNSPLALMANRVVLEITERAGLDQVRDVEARIAALRAMSFRIALDDIGAGYSSLLSLVALKPDIVKLDMELVRGVDRDATKREVIGWLVGLCRKLRSAVVAEGIETSAERDTLVALGCTLLQGFLFAKPAPPFPTPVFDRTGP
ncbi:MAG: EAL domain-containing protein [Proteobacteria bacterium]|nr:EAL domain-containing protein [Pseudomonadota bacterium]